MFSVYELFCPFKDRMRIHARNTTCLTTIHFCRKDVSKMKQRMVLLLKVGISISIAVVALLQLYLIPVDRVIHSPASKIIIVGNQSKTIFQYPILVPNMWNDSSSILPLWMKEYLAWHSRTRAEWMHPERWRLNPDERPLLLILQCTDADDKCGGTADRLKPLPLVILAASKSPRRRLILIRWKGRPCALEEFLVPPIGGLDWTVPRWLDDELAIPKANFSRRSIQNIQPFLHLIQKYANVSVITTKLQWPNGGETIFDNELKTPGEFRRIYHQLFRVTFTPTEPIKAHLNDVYERTWLRGKGLYVASHYRAFWWEQYDAPNSSVQVAAALNAVNCASTLRYSSSEAVYFASDSLVAIQAVEEYARESHRPIVVVRHSSPLIHLDRVRNASHDLIQSRKTTIKTWQVNELYETVSVSELYPTFVDLLLLGNARCVAYGEGGFGLFGLMMSYNSSCSFRHTHRHKLNLCDWKD